MPNIMQSRKVGCNIMDAMKTVIISDYLPPQYEGGGPVVSIENLLLVLNKNRIKPRLMSLKSASLLKISSNLKLLVEANVVYLNTFYGVSARIFFLVSIFLFRLNKLVIAPRGELAYVNVKNKKYIPKLIYNELIKITLKILSLKGVEIIIHTTSQLEFDETKLNFPKVLIPNIPRRLQSTNVVQGDEKILVNFGRIDPKKNLEFLIKTCAKLNDVSLVFIGDCKDYAYKSYLERLASHEGVDLNIIEHSTICTIQRIVESSVSAIVFPTKNENFGHAIAEALQMRALVFVTPFVPWAYLLPNWQVINGTQAFHEILIDFYTNPNDYQHYISEQNKIMDTWLAELNIDEMYMNLLL